jgi:hypothetical protein
MHSYLVACIAARWPSNTIHQQSSIHQQPTARAAAASPGVVYPSAARSIGPADSQIIFRDHVSVRALRRGTSPSVAFRLSVLASNPTSSFSTCSASLLYVFTILGAPFCARCSSAELPSNISPPQSSFFAPASILGLQQLSSHQSCGPSSRSHQLHVKSRNHLQLWLHNLWPSATTHSPHRTTHGSEVHWPSRYLLFNQSINANQLAARSFDPANQSFNQPH